MLKKIFLSFCIPLMVMSLMAQEHCPKIPVMYDADGNTYATVQIGSQCWMESNIHATKGKDGQEFEYGKKNLSYTASYYYYVNNDASLGPEYGYLYNWTAAKRVCPAGWHLPTKEDFQILIDYCKEHFDLSKEGKGWIAKSLVAPCTWPEAKGMACPGDTAIDSNAAHFSVKPAGMFNGQYAFGSASYFWTATQYGRSYAYNLLIYYAVPTVELFDDIQTSARSVRCVHD
jgi:uncharacterized protein (TIGR02145 family)